MLGEAVVIDSKRARVARLRDAIREACKLHERKADWQSHRLGRSACRKASADAPAPSSVPGDRTMKNPGFFTASPD